MRKRQMLVWLNVLVWIISMGGSVAADTASSGTQIEDAEPEVVDAVEVVEDIETVETANVIENDRADTVLSSAQLVGRNHPAMVHLPIGLMIGVLLLTLTATFFPTIPIGRSGWILSTATWFSFLPASVSGWLRAAEVYPQPSPLLLEHRNLMIGSLVVFTISLGLRLRYKADALRQTKLWYPYLLLLLLSVGLIIAGGHHGGQLVYGESFLPY